MRDGASAVTALAQGDVALIHGSLTPPVLTGLKERGPFLGIAHQAIYDSSRPAYFGHAAMLFAVSRHVLATLRDNGMTNCYAEPLFGVGEVRRLHGEAVPLRGPMCEWDDHKFFEKLTGAWHRMVPAVRTPTRYVRRPGLTLGVVSRIAKAKQFPALFEVLAPIIAAQARVNVEVFGMAVGAKQSRELRRALRPLGSRVRFWGHQRDVAPAYRAVDYLLTGLPDREALGLNVIESCLCGTPVLAVDAPPFTETMRDGVTGFLFTDPRTDQGRHFARLLAALVDGSTRPDMSRAQEHLELFSFENFADRVDAAMHEAVARTASLAATGMK